MNISRKSALLQKRKWRIRKTVCGTLSRPRLSLKISGKHIYAQAIDDSTGRTLAFLGTVAPEFRTIATSNKHSVLAEKLGDSFAKLALDAGVEKVVFDRNGRAYHGNVKSFADAARKGGLTF